MMVKVQSQKRFDIAQAAFDKHCEQFRLAPRSARVRKVRRAPQAPTRIAQQLIDTAWSVFALTGLVEAEANCRWNKA
ncbi:hypothetical protein [Noviherbaspirillum aerium]|uniref:hypothetical protein n=1 Tax=Noviherbaspirillum aerium TaxID=2588497 RepID=UPI00124D208A|nr:hypothetical protein [Noviherbaspirillum aerium]